MNEKEYREKIESVYPALFRVALSILQNEQDAADCLQEAVFRGWIKLKQLKNPESFRAWMIRITITEAKNLQRKAVRQRKTSPAPVPAPDTSVRDALFAIPEKYRIPLILFYMEGYSTREIAEMLKIPEGRLRERMRAGREKIRRLMENGLCIGRRPLLPHI